MHSRCFSDGGKSPREDAAEPWHAGCFKLGPRKLEVFWWRGVEGKKQSQKASPVPASAGR